MEDLAYILSQKNNLRNIPIALEWLQIATRLSESKFYYYALGNMYETILECYDIFKAVDMYSHAINLGHVGSLFRLAQIYESNPLLKDYHLAMKFYKKAARAGHRGAITHIKYLHDKFIY
jgi:TPR repeat protein